MTKFFAAGLAIVFLLVLTGCNPPKASPSPTAQKTLTEALPTATVLSRPADIETPFPTVQNTPTVPFPTLTTYSPSAYTIQRPDLQQLIGLISDLRTRAQESHAEDGWQSQVINSDSYSQDAFIAYDLQNHYAENIPNASQYVENLPDEWADLTGLPPVSIFEILQNHSIVDYLNENKIRLADRQVQKFPTFTAKSYLLDVEKVPGVEKNWLLDADFEQSGIGFWLTLAEDKNGIYKITPNNISSLYLSFDQVVDLKTDVDINNDHQNDLMIEKFFAVSNILSKTISIYTLDQQQINFLGTINLPQDGSYENLSQYDIGDHNQDGLLDIQVTSPRHDVFDCTWERKEISQFNGAKRTDQITGDEIPTTPECLLAKMLKSGQPDEMVALLKSARANLKPDASSDLRSWIQLRLAVLDYAQGRNQQALDELKAMSKFPVQGKGGFQKAVQAAYQQAGAVPLLLCEIINAAARQKQKSDGNFASDIDLDLSAYGAYLDVTHAPLPSTICPYLDMINLRFKKQKLDDDPVKAFASIGLQLSKVYQANLDADADPEWVGLLGKDKDSPEVVFVDRANGTWKITHDDTAYFWDDSISNLQVKMLDVTGDGSPELVISFAYQKRDVASVSGYKQCAKDEYYFSLEILDTSDTAYNSLVSKQFECVAQSPFDTLSAQELTDLYAQTKNVDNEGVAYPSWAKLQKHGWESKTILDDVSALEDLVLENEQPVQAQTEIKSMLASLPEGDSAAEILREHLLYLSGYSYELQGDDEKALAIYLSLIEKNPQSLWSRLAQSRLK